MKKVLILILLLLLVATGSSAATGTGSVRLNAEVVSPYIPPIITRELQITPAQGNLAPNCNQVTITWKTEYLVTSRDGMTGAVIGTTITDAIASTEVGYGVVTDSEHVVSGSAEINHSVTLSSLISGRTYKYYLKSADGTLTQKNTGGTFSVICEIANPSITVSPVNKGANVRITYPVGADVARLVIRRSTASAPTSMTQGESVYDGEQLDLYHDASISLGVTHWYSVFICNGVGVCSEGTFGSATRHIYPPTGFSATPSTGKINLAWSNPADNLATDFNFDGARLIRTDSHCASADINDGQLLVQGNVSGYEDTNVDNGTIYYYKVFVKNSYGEYSPGSCVSASPSVEAEAKCISEMNAMSGNSWVSLSWTNPASSASFSFNNVQWQRSGACVSSADSGQMVYSGTAQNFYDNGVINNTVYAYSAFVNYGASKVVSCGCVAAMPRPDTNPGDIDNPGGIGGLPAGVKQGPNADYGFYVGGGALKISTPDQPQLYILPGHSLTISILRSAMPKPVSLIVAQVGNKNYLMALDGAQDKYQTTFMVPTAPGDYNVQIFTSYFDQTGASQNWQLKVLPWGYISLDRRGLERVDGAKVVLKNVNGEFNGFGVTNPQTSGADGTFGYMVPNGLYDLEITKPGLRPYVYKGLRVDNNVINVHVDMAKDQNILKSVIDVFNNPQQMLGNISDIIRQDIIQNKDVKNATVNYAVPAVATFTAVSTVIAIPWWSLWYYLQYLFTEPFAWLLRRKKRGWGVVYNSITKEPIDLAVVRLYDKKTGRIVKSKITDREGRYNFFIDEGEYYMEAAKPNFIFPSAILREATEDKKYLDLYHGQSIVVKGGHEGVIVANIPLDQADIVVSDRQILRQHFWQVIRRNISIIGPIFSVIALVIYPGILTISFAIVHLTLYLLFRRLAEHKKAKSWGVIYDNNSKQLLGKAVVRIFSPEYGKMLEVQITDKHGRYGFLAEGNQYYITGAKGGYHDYKSDIIDLRGKNQVDIVGQDIALDRSAGTVSQAQSPVTAERPLPNQLPVAPIHIQSVEPPEAKQMPESESSPMEETAAKLREQAEKQSAGAQEFTDGFDATIMDTSDTLATGEGDESGDESYFDKLKQKTESPLDTITKEIGLGSEAVVPEDLSAGVSTKGEATLAVTPPSSESDLVTVDGENKDLSMEDQLLLSEVEQKFEAYKVKHAPTDSLPADMTNASEATADSAPAAASSSVHISPPFQGGVGGGLPKIVDAVLSSENNAKGEVENVYTPEAPGQGAKKRENNSEPANKDLLDKENKEDRFG